MSTTIDTLLHTLADQLAVQARHELEAACQAELLTLQTRLTTTAQALHRLETTFPIVGTDDVRYLRAAIAERVQTWMSHTLPEYHALQPLTPKDRLRADAARRTLINALHQALRQEFAIPELKALPQVRVSAAFTVITQTPLTLDPVWHAIVRQAIRQRVAFWAQRDHTLQSPSAQQSVRQHLWWLVKTEAATHSPETLAGRRHLLRLIDRALVPERYTSAS